MPLSPTWQDITIRLVLAAVASGLLGVNRGARGQPAGFRTTTLVGLAAAVAMVQMNLLLPVDGKTGSSFSVMDIMRLPLGILTGVGFIGGGTILRRGDLVTGVTTAATLWIVTVIGLCFGGGQIALGIGATLMSAATLWLFVWFDLRLRRRHRATVSIALDSMTAGIPDLNATILSLGYEARLRKRERRGDGAGQVFCFDISWRRAELAGPPLDLFAALDATYRVECFEMMAESEH
jgi:putative Mg2+ transporter-C (MgtC) family protein